MVSLCGLALSSLFVLNNKSVVHADSVSDAQNNAITWDSDQDDSQVVTQQTNASYTETEQSIPQKADDHQQNAAQPMQSRAATSTVRSVSATPRTTDQNTVVQSVQPSRVETSTVRSSSAAPRTTNQTAAVQSPKISNINDAQAAVPVVINNPANNKVHVHYVDSNGNSIDNSSYDDGYDDHDDNYNSSYDDGYYDYDIDVTETGQGSYRVPTASDGTKYQLNNPDGKYNIADQHIKHNGQDVYTYKGYGDYDDYGVKGNAIIKSVINNAIKHSSASVKAKVANADYNYLVVYIDSSVDAPGATKNEATISVYEVDKINPGEDIDEVVNSYAAQNGSKLPKYVKLGETTNLGDFYKINPVFQAHNATEGNWYSGSIVLQRALATENVFTDNSGNVKSVNGNTVNVVLTKPQSVNPASDTRCQAQATRTIQINFPDGQVPKSYDGIVDKSGKLVQTVHFTRTATEDALTGNILQYGNWTSDNKDHNFIGFEARTLPRIPGYTLKITPTLK